MARRKFFRNKSWDPRTDKYWGPLTYNSATASYHPLGVELSSGGGDGDDDGRTRTASLRISGLGHTLILVLPGLIRPWRQWVDTSRHDWGKSNGGGYWDVHPREYGFSYSTSDGFLIVSHGAQTGDSSTDQSWCCRMPWHNSHSIRHDYYGLDGALAYAEPIPRPRWDTPEHEAMDTAIRAVPTLTMVFNDYDGEAIFARVRLEERESARGAGRFRWLRYFLTGSTSRALSIEFSSEVGREKGSYKGGTLGHGISLEPTELHEAGFQRYCRERGLVYGGVAPDEAYPEKVRG